MLSKQLDLLLLRHLYHIDLKDSIDTLELGVVSVVVHICYVDVVVKVDDVVTFKPEDPILEKALPDLLSALVLDRAKDTLHDVTLLQSVQEHLNNRPLNVSALPNPLLRERVVPLDLVALDLKELINFLNRLPVVYLGHCLFEPLLDAFCGGPKVHGADQEDAEGIVLHDVLV